MVKPLPADCTKPASPSAQFLTCHATAALLGTPTRTVERWCRIGRLPAVRPGRAWLIPADVVAELRACAVAHAATRQEAGAA